MKKAMAGFAAGVMVAASIWSLILPAIEQSEAMGKLKFIPAATGFWIGILFLLLIDHLAPEKNLEDESNEKLLLAVTLHNIPEGMAVGVIYAGFLNHADNITALGAFSLALGIAIQNFPEGAIISMPLKAGGMSKRKAFLYGVLSGAVEPLASLFTLWAAVLVVPILPYCLSFAAGAMIFVVVEELIPKMSSGKTSDLGILMFSAGFTIMLILDVALG